MSLGEDKNKMPTYKDSNFFDITLDKNSIQYRSHVIEYNYVHSFQVQGRKLVLITSKKNEPVLSICFCSPAAAAEALQALRELRYRGDIQPTIVRRILQILG